MDFYLLFSGKQKWHNAHLQWTTVVSENRTSLCRSKIQGRFVPIAFVSVARTRIARVYYKTERKTHEVNDQPTYFPIYFSRLNRRRRQRLCEHINVPAPLKRLLKPIRHSPIHTLRQWNNYVITKPYKYGHNTIRYIALNVTKNNNKRYAKTECPMRTTDMARKKNTRSEL